MGKVRDHYGSQGDRNIHLPVRGHIFPMGRPCAHGCHKILTNWRLAEAVAAREGLHALGSPYISERASPRGTRCAHQLMAQHGSQRRYLRKRTCSGDFRYFPAHTSFGTQKMVSADAPAGSAIVFRSRRCLVTLGRGALPWQLQPPQADSL